MTGGPAATLPVGLLDGYAPDLRPLAPPVALGNAGGFSGSRFWRIEANAGPFLVRRWPSGTTAERLATVHRWVGHLGSTIPEVAVPLADRAGRTHHERDGHHWELTRFLPGAADLRRPPDPTRLATMFATLARVHDALDDERTLAPSPGLVARRDELRQLMDGEFDHLRSILADQFPNEAKTRATVWVNLAQTHAGRAAHPLSAAADHIWGLQPVLRDVRPDHFLFGANRLTGLVDFGAMGVESVASDLARLLGEVCHPLPAMIGPGPTPIGAIAAYQAVRPLAAEAFDLIGVFEGANAVLGGARWVRWHFVEARRFDEPDAVVRGLGRAVLRLKDWIMATGGPAGRLRS